MRASRRPGRSTAGSIAPGRLVAPSTNTLHRAQGPWARCRHGAAALCRLQSRGSVGTLRTPPARDQAPCIAEVRAKAPRERTQPLQRGDATFPMPAPIPTSGRATRRRPSRPAAAPARGRPRRRRRRRPRRHAPPPASPVRTRPKMSTSCRYGQALHGCPTSGEVAPHVSRVCPSGPNKCS
jgi:hypothetical protein